MCSKTILPYDSSHPYTDGKLRKIPGYFLTRFAFVKGRWLGKTLADIYDVEFSTKITDKVIKYRNLSINGEPAQSPDVKMKQNYYIESTVVTLSKNEFKNEISGKNLLR